jgi:putative spermidine/putrescine transport system substrate-binding protein
LCTSGTAFAGDDALGLATTESELSAHNPSRRTILKAGGAAVAVIGFPAIVRADPKEVVIGGPAGASKYFNSDLFPFLEKKLDIKILYEGSNSLTNLQKLQADKAAPKISVVIMDDPVMLPAADQGLITAMSVSSVPNLDRALGSQIRAEDHRAVAAEHRGLLDISCRRSSRDW